MTETEDRVRTDWDQPRELDCPRYEEPLTACRRRDGRYCSWCDRHVLRGDDGSIFAENHSANDIVQTPGTLTNPANQTELQFEKVFEEGYQQYWYRRLRGGFDGYGSPILPAGATTNETTG